MESADDKWFLCPKDKNHKLESKDRLIWHLNNCKLVKNIPEFYSCRYETYHLFATQQEKEKHELECKSAHKLKNMPIIQNFKIANPGYDKDFKPKPVDT